MAPVSILLFLEFFYLEPKSDDFINSSNVIIKNIKENIVEKKLSFPALSTRNRLDLCDNIAKLLRFFVRYLSRNSTSTGATLRAGFRLRYYSYYYRAANR